VRILLALRLAGKDVDGDPQLAGLLARIADDTDAAISELRDLGSGIRPVILTTRGVRAAVESLTGPFPIPVTIDIPERRFEASIEAGAYFFVAEALTNVIKHAEASAASVTVTEEGANSIAVEVADDGRGGALAVAGRGLAGMEDRLAALEGALRIDSPLGGGTRLTATLPVAFTTPAAG
jgi:signal transduction histidine kinase